MDLGRGLAIPHSGRQEKKHVAKCYTGAQTCKAFVNMVIKHLGSTKGKVFISVSKTIDPWS
jgi:mannitol/fructose-specific phosphotransferase system IIA component